MYPPVKEVGLRLHDVAAFCFPGGVKVSDLYSYFLRFLP